MDYGQPKYSQVLLGLLILSKNEIIGFRKKTIVLENEPLVLNFQKTKSDRFLIIIVFLKRSFLKKMSLMNLSFMKMNLIFFQEDEAMNVALNGLLSR